MNKTMISASIFSPGQLSAIIIIAVFVVLLVAFNIGLYYFLRRHRERKLCTTRLQAKRNELLNHLKNISDDGSVISGGTIYSDVDEPEDDSDEADIDDEDDEDELVTAIETVGEDEDITHNEILAVADMSDYTRSKLNLVGDEYDNKRYYVRYKYGFEAKLRSSSDEVKERYTELVKELSMYKGIKISSSFRGQRIYKGKKTLGQIFLRGKTLCIALALDPKEFNETKYHVVDMSDKKRFINTPTLYKLISMRRVDYARYLIMRIAEINMISPDPDVVVEPVDLSMRTPDELYVAQGLRIAILGEAPQLEEEAEPEISIEETDETAVSDTDDNTDDETDELDNLAIETPQGKIVFDRSFTARLIQSNDALKARYSEIKNYILAYKGVRSKASWKKETFSIGRKTIATFAIRGKTLMMYLATDPVKFVDTKYRVENMSEVASRRSTPLLFRVKSDRSTAYAKQLIDIVFAENGSIRVERRPQDYTVPYKSTDDLVKRGLIKLTTQYGSFLTKDK